MGKGALSCDNEGLRGPHCQQNRSTFPMRKSTGSYPSLIVDTTAKRVISHAGAMLLSATAGRVGLDRELSSALRPWMRPSAIHDPGKVLLDLAISVAIGGDCLADIAQVRSEPDVFGHVASDPTVSRLIDTLRLMRGPMTQEHLRVTDLGTLVLPVVNDR